MLKLLFLAHRYLGIGLGLVMVLWCLSGFVMMYKAYPELNAQEQLATLAPLDLANCCTAPEAAGGDAPAFTAFHVQMIGEVPVLTLTGVDGVSRRYDLASAEPLVTVDHARATLLAAEYSQREDLGNFRLIDLIDNDQWSVYGAYNPLRPLYKFAADDDAGTQWYISSRSGEVIQVTTANDRLWGTLGAVIHWLYPTLLREQVPLWSQTVIWLTVFSIFLTITGLYFGIRQYKTRENGRRSPYRGLSGWHHYSGLVFGVLTLSWVFSGLFSMNPWGLLEGDGMRTEQALLRGGNLTLAEIAPVLARVNLLQPDTGVVRLEGEKLLGELYLYAVNRAGDRTRLQADTLREDILLPTVVQKLAARLSPDGPPVLDLISAGDSYYYDHHEKVSLPAWRIISGGPDQTRYYLDAQSGALLSRIDTEQRWYRWLFYGLHRGDFTAAIRARPVWDILMWSLLLGVTLTCITGFSMGVRRLARKRHPRRMPAKRRANVYSLSPKRR